MWLFEWVCWLDINTSGSDPSKFVTRSLSPVPNQSASREGTVNLCIINQQNPRYIRPLVKLISVYWSVSGFAPYWDVLDTRHSHIGWPLHSSSGMVSKSRNRCVVSRSHSRHARCPLRSRASCLRFRPEREFPGASKRCRRCLVSGKRNWTDVSVRCEGTQSRDGTG